MRSDRIAEPTLETTYKSSIGDVMLVLGTLVIVVVAFIPAFR